MIYRPYLLAFSVLTALLGSGCSGKKLASREKKAGIYYDHGTNNLVKKDYTSALKHLLKAKELSPSDARVYNNLGMTYYFKGEYAKALSHLERAVSLDKKNSDARNNLASVYLQLGKEHQARGQYEKVLEDLVYDHHYRTYYNLALIDLRQGNTARAMENLKKSIKDKEDYCPALYTMGMVEKGRAHLAQALKYFRQGIQGACYQQPATHYQIALVLSQLGQEHRALDSLQTIVEKFPQGRYSVLANERIKMVKKSLKEGGKKKYREKYISKKKRADELVEKIPKPLSF